MATDANKITGNFYVRVDGAKLPLTGSATLKNIGGVEREAVVGDAVHGYREKVVAPEVELTITKTGGLSIKDLAKITGATVTVETDNGDSYVIGEAWAASPGELSSNGEIKMTFTGKSCEEQLGG